VPALSPSIAAKQVRLVGVLQLGAPGVTLRLPDPLIHCLRVVWEPASLEDDHRGRDLLILSAERASPRTVLRALARLRARGWSKALLLWLHRDQVLQAHRYVAAGVTDLIFSDAEASEVSCRLNAALVRRTAPPGGLRRPRVTLDWDTRRVVVGMQSVTLSYRELKLLDVMLRHATPIPPFRLAWEAWGIASIDHRHLITSCISSLRKKLARFGTDFGIRTHRGVGYSVEVESIDR
jgi:two-component system, OmpR family, response regulator